MEPGWSEAATRLCCRGTLGRRRRSPSSFRLKRVVGVICVCFVRLQEMTTGRRPTIQTTVTASSTKSSPGGCNQMSPARFASTYVCLSEPVPPSLCLTFTFSSITPILLWPPERCHLTSLIDAGSARPPGAANLLAVPSLLLLVKARVPAEPLEGRAAAAVC